jgi:hypothetical protein
MYKGSLYIILLKFVLFLNLNCLQNTKVEMLLVLFSNVQEKSPKARGLFANFPIVFFLAQAGTCVPCPACSMATSCWPIRGRGQRPGASLGAHPRRPHFPSSSVSLAQGMAPETKPYPASHHTQPPF